MIIGLPGFIAEEQICNYLLFKTLISKAVFVQIVHEVEMLCLRMMIRLPQHPHIECSRLIF